LRCGIVPKTLEEGIDIDLRAAGRVLIYTEYRNGERIEP
jgi:hypothetical protein